MERILDIRARQVLDSRGNPTVEVDVYTENGMGSAIDPSGASTGKHEAVELRDHKKAYDGLGVKHAVRNVNTVIKKALVGKNALDQAHIDGELLHLDHTKNKRRLGANAILGVSLAVARAAASSRNLPLFSYLAEMYGAKPVLPLPFANVINGGKHAAGNLEFQEFMIVPVKAKTFAEAVQMIAETYHALGTILKDCYGPTAEHIGDEGGYAPPINSPQEALNLLVAAVKKAGYTGKIKYAIDAAASSFYYPHHRAYLRSGMSAEELTLLYKKLLAAYPIISLEDPFDEEDFSSFSHLLTKLRSSKKIQIVGDDLTVTNTTRIQRAIDEKSCNALLLKVNQVGTLTEALCAARMATRAKWKVMVSHRSGETEDAFIADLAVALGCGQIKIGAPARGERTAKYNQLLRIEEYLGKKIMLARWK